MGVCEPGQGGNAAAISNAFMCAGEPPRLSQTSSSGRTETQRVVRPRAKRRTFGAGLGPVDFRFGSRPRPLSFPTSSCSGTTERASWPQHPGRKSERRSKAKPTEPVQDSVLEQEPEPQAEPSAVAATMPLKEKEQPASVAPRAAPANYTVVARRYRPQRFEDVVGQDHVVQALRNAIRFNRLAQAYLFCGTRGVGKTSMARIFAKCLNCVQGPTESPCQVCDICQAIASGQDVDVIEIDGASNNGVEQVRELRQNASLRPSRSRFKIYYIDEVHMLSTGAFNALLKTLEEPPPHVKFFFATTEGNKIPITVLSRCQRYDFAGITPDAIVGTLQEICTREQVEAEPEALQVVARRAGGSMRDAQSLLEQLLASGSPKLTVEVVHALLGTPSDERLAGDARGARRARLGRGLDAARPGRRPGRSSFRPAGRSARLRSRCHGLVGGSRLCLAGGHTAAEAPAPKSRRSLADRSDSRGTPDPRRGACPNERRFSWPAARGSGVDSGGQA